PRPSTRRTAPGCSSCATRPSTARARWTPTTRRSPRSSASRAALGGSRRCARPAPGAPRSPDPGGVTPPLLRVTPPAWDVAPAPRTQESFMTVSPATETPASDRRRRPGRSGRLTARDLQGALYASPTLVFVLFLFVVPLGLVLYMSTHKWSLLGGKQSSNFPANFQQALERSMFWPAVSFTAKYTVIATVLLIDLGLCLALLVQESSRWKGFLRTMVLVPSALGLASA